MIITITVMCGCWLAASWSLLDVWRLVGVIIIIVLVFLLDIRTTVKTTTTV